jgi:hypothetical protein
MNPTFEEGWLRRFSVVSFDGNGWILGVLTNTNDLTSPICTPF